MLRRIALLTVFAVVATFAMSVSETATAQNLSYGNGRSIVVPPSLPGMSCVGMGRRPQQGQYIPPSQGQYPVHVTGNEVIGVNPNTGGFDTQNRQIDNTAYQIGRNESQNNGTKRWVRRPVHNAQGQVVGYQEGYVWINSITGQEHGELTNYTPNDQGGVHGNIQSRSVTPGKQPKSSGGVHRNYQSFGATR